MACDIFLISVFFLFSLRNGGNGTEPLRQLFYIDTVERGGR
jgi:hypothetical protein